MRLTARAMWIAALVVSLVATIGSLSLSGVGMLGWRGVGLFPCELCWYQRILMYPLPFIIGIGLWRRDASLAWLVLPMSVLGLLVASYHVLIQFNPSAEVGECFVGSCATIDWRFLDLLTVPQLSAIAFALVTAAALFAHAWSQTERDDA